MKKMTRRRATLDYFGVDCCDLAALISDRPATLEETDDLNTVVGGSAASSSCERKGDPTPTMFKDPQATATGAEQIGETAASVSEHHSEIAAKTLKNQRKKVRQKARLQEQKAAAEEKSEAERTATGSTDSALAHNVYTKNLADTSTNKQIKKAKQKLKAAEEAVAALAAVRIDVGDNQGWPSPASASTTTAPAVAQGLTMASKKRNRGDDSRASSRPKNLE